MATGSCVAEWCADAEWCDVTCTAEVLSGKWHPVVVSPLLEGPMGFAALEDAADALTSPVLSSTLERLEADGVVERSVVSGRPHRVEYALAERGRALEPVVEAMAAWGEQYGTGDDA